MDFTYKIVEVDQVAGTMLVEYFVTGAEPIVLNVRATDRKGRPIRKEALDAHVASSFPELEFRHQIEKPDLSALQSAVGVTRGVTRSELPQAAVALPNDRVRVM